MPVIKHLYGPNSLPLSQPLEWPDLQVAATINDDSTEANISVSQFTFVGTAADYLLGDYIPQYGVFNGCKYKIVVEDDNISSVVFDGFIVLSELQENSKEFPRILVCPIRDLNNNVTVFDQVAILTQLLLKKQGWIQPSDFKDLPVVVVSKKGAKDRAVALGNLAFTVITFFTSAVQNFLSAISDILGVSVAIGLVELATFVIELLIEIQQLVDLIIQHKDLLLASQTWNKVIGLKTVIERAFESLGYTVDFGEIDPVISKLYLKKSQNGLDGFPVPGLPGDGTLNRSDYGYLIQECMEGVKALFNTRNDVQGTVAHIKHKKDAFWDNTPQYSPDPVLIETTEQYDNGVYRNKTEEVFATTIIQFPYDATDAWTLTEDNDDSYEIHRSLIDELDPKCNTLKGLEDIQIPWAQGVRYDAQETLIDLMQEAFTAFGGSLDVFQEFLVQFEAYIDSAAGVGQEFADALALSPLNFFFAVKAGGLKIEDDVFGMAKIVYAEEELDDNQNPTGRLRIPTNFKNFIGAKSLYTNWYFPDSPAVQNNFAGQYIMAENVVIPFNLKAFQLTNLNPHFLLNANNAKFTHIAWTIDKHKAETDIEINKPFDQNITEEEI